MSGPRVVRSPRVSKLTCANWQIEAPYRMLQNNLDPEVAERPDDLVVYGGTGRAARSWEAFDAMMRTMQTLKPDETMLVQSGKPVGVFRTHEWAPRVLLANSNLVGEWATWDEFRRLENMDKEGIRPKTKATAIQIGKPANILKGLRALEFTNSYVPNHAVIIFDSDHGHPILVVPLKQEPLINKLQ